MVSQPYWEDHPAIFSESADSVRNRPTVEPTDHSHPDRPLSALWGLQEADTQLLTLVGEDGLCEHCGELDDTIHRIQTCPRYEDKRNDAMLALGPTLGGEIPLDQIPQNGVAWKLLAEFSRPLASHD
ncbi:hypothetical protein M8J77_009849 [Diaphorina citri]|nr:hypothetical protein M8J77_009849 [Diaphorina citri]